jgi:23S rRNA (pseudouridine1915-N3)-methyltransferase
VKFRLVVVGKPPAGPLRDAIEDYEKRASRYWPLDVVEVRAESARSRATKDVKRLEGERLLDKVAGTLVALDEKGKTFTSEKFAQWMVERREHAEDTTFVIGGAYGLDEVVRQRAAMLLSLSPWTLQHEMARLLLAEQLFRAGTIHRGEPYHKGG